MWENILGSGLGAAIQAGFGAWAASENERAQKEQAELDYQRQKEFAQNSIQWRVNDAKAAGLHPLAALGSGSSFYTPTSYSGGMDTATNLAQTGQSLSSVVRSAMDTNAKLDVAIRKEQLRGIKLQNDKLEKDSSLSKTGQVPLPTQSTIKPRSPIAPLASSKDKVITGNKSAAKEKPAFQLLRGVDGYAIVPSQELSDASDAQLGIATGNAISRQWDPEYWYNLVKHDLPKLPDDMEWVMRRDHTGWNPYAVSKDEWFWNHPWNMKTWIPPTSHRNKKKKKGTYDGMSQDYHDGKNIRIIK